MTAASRTGEDATGEDDREARTAPGRASGPTGPSAPLIALVALLLACGAAAGPHPWDAGEIASASVRLGASHAPGQPLHALLGWAAAHLLPMGPMPWRLSLLSTTFAALAAYVAGRIVVELTLAGPRARPALVANATAVAVLMCPPLLRQALRPEVYSLALFLFLGGAWALVRWAKPGHGHGHRSLLPAALAVGLLFSVHPPHALALTVVGLCVAALRRRDALRSARAIGWAFLAFAAGLGALAYLPVRARAGAPMWGDPTTLDGFFAYVSARAYRGNLVGPGLDAGVPMAEAARLVVLGGGGIPLLAIAGAAIAWVVGRTRRSTPAPSIDRSLVVALGAAVALLSATLFTPDERIPDHVAYLAPAVALSIVGGALSLSALSERKPALGAFLLVTLATVPTALPALPSTIAADLPSLESFAFALVDAPPPRALALVRTDFVAASWFMDAAVDRTRPDVASFAEGLATSSWHWHALRGHPACPDGAPGRIGDGPGAEPWIRGLVLRATASVPIAAEDHDGIARLGWIDGAYVRTPPPGASAEHVLYATDGSGERALMLLSTTLTWAPGGDHDVASDIVRAALVERARRLFIRGEVILARAAIVSATAPLDRTEVEPLMLLDATAARPLVPAVADPDALFMGAEDAVRVGATMLHSAGRRASASALLEAQLNRGDTRAMLQLGWLLVSDGATAQAREIANLYVTTSPERAAEALPLIEAIARASSPP